MQTLASTSRRAVVTLAACLAFLCGALASQAQTVITSLPYTINSSGTYVLNTNLNSAQTTGNLITVNASNVVIDFQNHYIAGPVGNTTQTTYGVYANEQSNVTIKNGTIAYCYAGVRLEGNGSATTNSVGHLIDNMRATYCYYIGLWVLSSPASRITNSQVSQGGYSGTTYSYGIVGSGAGQTISNCVISGLTASTTAFGIYMNTGSFARQNTISNCTQGVYGGKYQDNLTANCTTAYGNGADAGGNN